MEPKFKPTGKGLVITDPIERERYPLETDTSVTPIPVDGDQIPYPMDSAASITTNCLTLPENPLIYVRDLDGTLCREVQPGDDVLLSKNEYVLDLSGPLKIYAHVNSAVRIQTETRQAKISFEQPTRITISARSFHRRPAETITTTAKPTDVMQAISMFGSSLSTTTSERSYPTLRGHPPVFEQGNELSIPDSLNRPQTGIKIEIPPTLRHVFAITSLAYYLGAKVVPGSTPQLVTETGYRHRLKGKEGFETMVEQILKHIFFLDCIVQTEGETPSDLYERRAIEPLLEFDLEELYEQSLAEKLETYLEVPFDTLESEVPAWYSEVRLEPTADHIEFLPFIANDLASVKFPNGNMNSKYRISRPVVQQYWKNSSDGTIVSTKPLSAFQNSITQSPRDGSLRTEVVCNDPSMNDELVTIYSTYSKGSDASFDVTVHHDLSKEGLEQVFAKESDFLHYIGHIDTDGFRCSDGTLDAADIDSVGIKTVFLNACQSYKQGLELIEAGSLGGIVTLTEIENCTAVDTGSKIARLLSNGVSLHTALTILQQTTSSEHQYHLLGDELSVMTNREATPVALAKISINDGKNELKVFSHVNSRFKPGSVYIPYISATDSYYLVPKEVTFDHVSKANLLEFLNQCEFPVIFENKLRWSTEIKTSEL